MAAAATDTTREADRVELVDARHPSVVPAWRRITSGNDTAAGGASSATAFSSLTWFEALRDSTATGDLRVVVVRRGPAIIGLLPLEWVRTDALRTVALAGAWAGADHLDVVAAPEHAAAVADAALLHVAQRHDWDRLRFDGVAAGGELQRALERWRRRTPLLIHRGVVTHVAPLVRVERLRNRGSAVDSITHRSSRHTTRSALRKVRASGGGLAVSRAPDDVAADLVELMRLHRRQFGRRSVVVATESRRDFHLDAARRLAADGRAVSWRFVDGETVVKVGYGFVNGDVVATYLSGRIDPRDTRLRSPGIVGTAAFIDWAIEAGFSGVDLLRGEQNHKRLFATDERAVHRYETFRATPATAAYVGIRGARRARAIVRRRGHRK